MDCKHCDDRIRSAPRGHMGFARPQHRRARIVEHPLKSSSFKCSLITKPRGSLDGSYRESPSRRSFTQIADGENGGVMNERVSAQVHGGCERKLAHFHSASKRHGLSRRLVCRRRSGGRSAHSAADFSKADWDRMEPDKGPDILARVIEEIRKEACRGREFDQ